MDYQSERLRGLTAASLMFKVMLAENESGTYSHDAYMAARKSCEYALINAVGPYDALTIMDIADDSFDIDLAIDCYSAQWITFGTKDQNLRRVNVWMEFSAKNENPDGTLRKLIVTEGN